MNNNSSRSARRASASLGVCLALAAGAAGAADLINGNRIYQMRCVGCHGIDGKAINPAAPSFILGERLSQPDMALMLSLKTGKTKCPPFFGVLKDQEILDALTYARTLRR